MSLNTSYKIEVSSITKIYTFPRIEFRINIISKYYLFFFICSINFHAYAACPLEGFVTANGIALVTPAVPQDISQQELSANLVIPISFGIGGEALYPSITAADINIQVSHPAIVWRYYARAGNLDLTNLSISYQLSSGGALVSSIDANSRIRATPSHREIRLWRWFGYTVFDAYVDFSFDLSDTTHAGLYEGVLTVDVECNR